ncbi:MAG: adenylate/guanylate cyclase domain-containing protein [Armatimonadetes bacterium]|nr:adenylate/guanylate cyclase domain-containing protein [Armatimonadota bacterium]
MKKQTMSVGFADIRNFMRLADEVGTEKAIGVLQDGLVFAGDAIVSHGGEIRKYMGDALLFTFSDSREAVSAAREIAQYRREIGAVTISYYVAIATGEVAMAQIGHPSYVVEDIFGETVNRAAILLNEARESEEGIALCQETQKYA